ncbi:hypothetical protein EDC04DRAFT_2624336 [Pisolithus marmoratus]|nr:hypothetical protein EDC04DRAFT_2624336 [Pisolithus marmoratus]
MVLLGFHTLLLLNIRTCTFLSYRLFSYPPDQVVAHDNVESMVRLLLSVHGHLFTRTVSAYVSPPLGVALTSQMDAPTFPPLARIHPSSPTHPNTFPHFFHLYTPQHARASF